MVEVMDHANACLTWRERYVLVAIADNLRDNTRCGWPAFDGEDQYAERFRLRTCCSRTQFYEALQGLTDMGVVKILEAGHNGRRAEYYIPPLAALVLQPRRPKKKSAKSSVRETGTLQGVGRGVSEGYREPLPEPTASDSDSSNRDTTSAVVSRFDGSSVRETGTPTPQVSSGTASLNNADAAGAGWGVWGEGAIDRQGDEPAAVAAVVADAPPGDGLRPRDYVAPANDGETDASDEDEPQPPPVAEVLTPEPGYEPAEHPGVGDLVPRQIKRAQQQWQPEPKPERPKPPRWAPAQDAQQKAEYQRIYDTVNLLDDDHGRDEAERMLREMAIRIQEADHAAHHDGWNAAVRQFGTTGPVDPAGAALHRYRLAAMTVVRALHERPLGSWPESVRETLPPGLAGDAGFSGLAAVA